MYNFKRIQLFGVAHGKSLTLSWTHKTAEQRTLIQQTLAVDGWAVTFGIQLAHPSTTSVGLLTSLLLDVAYNNNYLCIRVSASRYGIAFLQISYKEVCYSYI